MDRLRAYEIFMTVVNKGSFSKAADLLDTSPANVTRYINDLEGYLGCRLLNRSSRKLSLTESGEALFERCKTILAEVAETEALVSSAAVQPRGRLRINAPLSFGILHLAPIWPAFSRRYPQLELDITLTDRVVDIVEEGYDLVIRISRSGSVNHAARKLASSFHPAELVLDDLDQVTFGNVVGRADSAQILGMDADGEQTQADGDGGSQNHLQILARTPSPAEGEKQTLLQRFAFRRDI